MHVRLGPKIANRLGKMSENLKGDFLDSQSHTVVL